MRERHPPRDASTGGARADPAAISFAVSTEDAEDALHVTVVFKDMKVSTSLFGPGKPAKGTAVVKFGAR